MFLDLKIMVHTAAGDFLATCHKVRNFNVSCIAMPFAVADLNYTHSTGNSYIFSHLPGDEAVWGQ